MEKTNLREEIIQNSTELFEKHGYAATSVRKIAKKSGCTAGSIYYFFEGGKAEILQEVIRSYGIDPNRSLSWVTEEKSLDDLIDRLFSELPIIYQNKNKRLNWLFVDIAGLDQETIETIKKYPLSIAEGILRGVRSHIDDPKTSLQIAWLINSTIYGFTELSERIGLEVEEQPSLDDMRETVKTAIKTFLIEND